MKIRKIEIDHYRGIKNFSWCPSGGLNCLIGPGDSCKSTILDAIDLCIGARRTAKITDADFYMLDVETPISITLTVGDLNDALLNLDYYGLFLRGFDTATGGVADEPGNGLETVLTLNVLVESDLEPIWSLFSERAAAQNSTKNLRWKDRLDLAPSRIGAFAGYDLGWRKGSVLSKLTGEQADTASTLAAVVRQAREAFGADAERQLSVTLQLVSETANELGIDIGGSARALLDNYSVNLNGGTVSLHNKEGIPLQNLGIGSLRLLVAGLQRKAAEKAPMLLVDEIEYGLEPHRIMRFLGSLGAKENEPLFQVFLTTHSPVVLRELSGAQMYVLRKSAEGHVALNVGTSDAIQGTIRAFPEAFLARSVVICEGASEVGIVRGLDICMQHNGKQSIFACGTALVDAGGVHKVLGRAIALQTLGYRVAVFRDDDEQPSIESEREFEILGGVVFKWHEGEKLESEVFMAMPDEAINLLLNIAVGILGDELVNDHLKNASNNEFDLRKAIIKGHKYNDKQRRYISVASTGKKNPWYKNVSTMEIVGKDVVGNYLDRSYGQFRDFLLHLMQWARNE